jgi:DNA integrity scanning protein DisA with diadenylate cyclase activity
MITLQELVSKIKDSNYTYIELSYLSNVPVRTISSWVINNVNPSAQSAINMMSVLGLGDMHDVKNRMKSARGSHTIADIEKVSGIPLKSLENYLYYNVMPSYQNYIDYMQTMEKLND